MKKELNKANKKLTLGKMTVAKLRLNKQEMRFLKGGEETTALGKTSIDPEETNCTRTGTRPTNNLSEVC